MRTLGGLEPLRAVLEYISRHITLRRRLEVAYGRELIYVSPGAMLRLWRRDVRSVDPQLFAWAERYVKPGAAVWDIGANAGLFSVAAAVRAGANGTVVAVEADAWLVGLLRKTSRAGTSNRAAIEVIPAAITDSVSLVTFNIAARGRAANFVGTGFRTTQAGGVREQQTVVGITLDWLAEHTPIPDLVKIDVEGAELAVLTGAERLLTDHRPTFILEVRRETRADIAALFARHGYTLFNPNTVEQIIDTEVIPGDVLARPRSGSR